MPTAPTVLTTPSTGRLAAAVAAGSLALLLPVTAVSASAEPTGLGYAPANRALTVPFAALLIWLLAERGRTARAGAPRWGTAAGVGAAAMLVGNVVEFWLVLVQDRPVSAIATDRHQAAWIGSDIGWLTFLPGMALLLVALVAGARAQRRAGMLTRGAALARPGWVLALLVAMTTWASSVGATVVAGCVCALLLLAAATDATPQSAARDTASDPAALDPARSPVG